MDNTKPTKNQKNFYLKIINIQKKLKAPKNQYNSFGKYNYRSCEDILEALKPLLAEERLLLTVSDEVIQINNRYYIRATATLTDGTNSISNTAYAREEEEKKGMDGSQITGASSSYARKYALNGLFLIDDTKDSDYTNNHNLQKQETKIETKEGQGKQVLANWYKKIAQNPTIVHNWDKTIKYFEGSEYYERVLELRNKHEKKEEDNSKMIEQIFGI